LNLAELCRRYEISRQTGYKLERYQREGEVGTGGTQPGACASPASNAGESPRNASGTAEPAPELGATEAARLPAARIIQDPMAGGQRHRRPAAQGRFGASAAKTKADPAVHPASETCRSAESGVVRGRAACVGRIRSRLSRVWISRKRFGPTMELPLPAARRRDSVSYRRYGCDWAFAMNESSRANRSRMAGTSACIKP
jgi:hypothetical protein